MDARKGSYHLASLISRLREEAVHFNGRVMLKGTDPEAAPLRRRRFLDRVADHLSRPAEVCAATASAPMSAMTGLTRRAAGPTLQVEAAS